MKKITLTIDESLDGARVEAILKLHLEMSNALITRLKRTDGAILICGKVARAIDRVSSGDTLEIIIHEKKSNIEKWDFPLDVLYEDEDVIAVNKPRQMPTHPSRWHTDKTLLNAVAHYLKNSEGFHIITRLDKDTSGVVLIAKNRHSAKILTEGIRDMKKEYVAVVNGVPEPENGTIDRPIAREGNTIKRCVREEGKSALTHYVVEEKKGEFTIVRLFPVTGRTHQLRVHLSHIGCPIYGDSMYGAPQMGERTLLHAKRLEFIHPIKKEEMVIEAPLPADIKRRL